MQFLTTCLHCGQSIRKGSVTCPVCGQPATLSPLQDASYGERRGQERLTWASLIGISMEHLGYGFAGLAVVDGLWIVLQAHDARLLPWFGGFTSICLMLIFLGRYMRDNLQRTTDWGLPALTLFLFRIYPANVMIGLTICSGCWAFFRWLDFSSRSPDRGIAGWMFLTLFVIVFIAESRRSTIADDDA